MDRLGLTENTLVVFTSDNGPVLDDGYQDRAVELVGDHKIAGPYRGGKTSMYDGGTCVPFMLRWPGSGQAGCFGCIGLPDGLAGFTGGVDGTELSG